ncbi:MAG: histidine phosphatase family protein, partial [bacterium]|nr:histidine phosphatase family protein [bacterium]
ESKANVAGIIVSDPKIGTTDYGLTDLGRKQIKDSFQPNNITKIYSSDFLRARETAQIAAQLCSINHIEYTHLLRERYFGDHDGKPDKHYGTVWQEDQNNPDNTNNNVESPNSVKERVFGLIKECEKKHKNETILFVSHGDALQILLAIMQGLPSNKHRSLPHLDKSEIREITPDTNLSQKE